MLAKKSGSDEACLAPCFVPQPPAKEQSLRQVREALFLKRRQQVEQAHLRKEQAQLKREHDAQHKALEARAYRHALQQEIQSVRAEAKQSTVLLLRKLGVVNALTEQKAQPPINQTAKTIRVQSAPQQRLAMTRSNLVILPPIAQAHPRADKVRQDRADEVRDYVYSFRRQRALREQIHLLQSYIKDLRGAEQSDDVRMELAKMSAQLVAYHSLWSDIRKHAQAVSSGLHSEGLFQITRRVGDEERVTTLDEEGGLSFRVGSISSY